VDLGRTRGVYPEIAPHDRGWLPVGDGHELYWEVCGSPRGTPAVVLHGGPGAGAAPWWRGLLDPTRFRAVLFDQRGCGRSRPHAADTLTALAANTTEHLVGDIDALRRHLGVERWLVVGGSWGSTLALAYGETHPDQVIGMVLFSVVTTTGREVDWITGRLGRLHPEAWERFVHGSRRRKDERLVDAYARLLADDDVAVCHQAAADWCTWEDHIAKADDNDTSDPRYEDSRFRLAFARLVTHYWRHAAWLEDGSLLDNIHVLRDVPASLIHACRDLSSPVDIPWQLARCWPASRLIIVDAAGHRAGSAMTEAIVNATQHFA
jgi:proline iminopeptidase